MDHLLQGKFISRYVKPSQSQTCNGNRRQDTVAVPRRASACCIEGQEEPRSRLPQRGHGAGEHICCRSLQPGCCARSTADPYNLAAVPGQINCGKSTAPSHTPVPAHAVLHYESRPANVLMRVAQESPCLGH